MSAVRHYRDDAPEALREQIDDFIFQVSTHSREHVFFNRQARDAGYDLTSSEDRAARTIAWAKRRPPLMQLAGTCALDHFTATQIARAAWRGRVCQYVVISCGDVSLTKKKITTTTHEK